MTCYQSIKVPREINIKRAWGKKQGNMRTMFKTFDNERFCKTVKDKSNASTTCHHYQMQMKETTNQYI